MPFCCRKLLTLWQKPQVSDLKSWYCSTASISLYPSDNLRVDKHITINMHMFSLNEVQIKPLEQAGQSSNIRPGNPMSTDLSLG